MEVAQTIRRGVIRYDGGFSRWADRPFVSGRFVAADLTVAIVVKVEGLYAFPERGDRSSRRPRGISSPR
jgi:hypothetical protein